MLAQHEDKAISRPELEDDSHLCQRLGDLSPLAVAGYVEKLVLGEMQRHG
jgi:hypothetical protein